MFPLFSLLFSGVSPLIKAKLSSSRRLLNKAEAFASQNKDTIAICIRHHKKSVRMLVAAIARSGPSYINVF